MAETSGQQRAAVAAAVAGTAAAAAAGYLLYQQLALRRMSSRSTTTSAGGGPLAYETSKAVDEYLQMHFASADEIFPYEDAPKVRSRAVQYSQ